MKVKELRAILDGCPDDAEVVEQRDGVLHEVYRFDVQVQSFVVCQIDRARGEPEPYAGPVLRLTACVD